MSEFKRADVAKLESFKTDSEEVIEEFADIRKEFDNINKTLMDNWDGQGKNAFSEVALHITDNIGEIQSVLNEINNNVLNDLIAQYNKIDHELAEYNNNAGSKKEGSENG